MGSSVSNAANSAVGTVRDAASSAGGAVATAARQTGRQARRTWDEYAPYINVGTALAVNAYRGYRRDGGAYEGAMSGVAETAQQARVISRPDDPAAPVIPAEPDAALVEADPAKRKRRLMEGRAGTILTGGGAGGGGTNLGGSGGRSTLLGL